MKPIANKYTELLDNIGSTLHKAKEHAIKAINAELIKANWEIGMHIVEFEQHGKEKADYGSSLLTTLAKDLKIRHGKGFSKSSIYLCRQFYIKYPKFQTLSGKLSWSHMPNCSPSRMTWQGFFMKSKASKKTGVSEN